MEVHVQFSDSDQTKIVSVFGCPQDPDVYPNQASIDFDDPRYRAFLNPPPLVPSSVSMRQARLALHAAGKLRAVDDAIAALPSSQRDAAQIEWEFASQIERGSPFLQQMATALGMDDKALDDLFLAAAGL